MRRTIIYNIFNVIRKNNMSIELISLLPLGSPTFCIGRNLTIPKYKSWLAKDSIWEKKARFKLCVKSFDVSNMEEAAIVFWPTPTWDHGRPQHTMIPPTHQIWSEKSTEKSGNFSLQKYGILKLKMSGLKNLCLNVLIRGFAIEKKSKILLLGQFYS